MIGQEARLKRISSILPRTEKIRNVSIVAHVDHGKTTLADCLISSNGLIHKKQAGHLKLLDDRFDQQDRGITMKSSSISLLYNDHLINLIDSPGHLEFYSEVSSALRLTDSALLVVDVVEGVSSQTFRVLKQLYTEKLPAILILNKLDKLITHCQMDPLQAYNHISQIIEQVNAILGSFIIKEVNIRNAHKSKSQDLSQQNIQQLESMFYFSAEKKNIVFGTALDNWGFSPQTFAHLIAKKIGSDPQQIVKYLWGDYYYNFKTKQFSQKPRTQNQKPICVELVLRPIWDIYENVQNKNFQKVDKIINTLGIKVSENAKKLFNQQLIRQILTNWIPIDKVVMKKIVEILPNPSKAQSFRLPYLLQLSIGQQKVDPQVIDALSKCDNSAEKPFIAFISKMVNIPKTHINERGLNPLEGDGQNRALAFGRIFSGSIKRGQQISVIGAKKTKIQNEKGQITLVPNITKIVIKNLYIFNAQYPEGVEQAFAGNIVGFGNLEDCIFKSGTISSIENCISFTPVVSQTKSLLKVSVRTQNIEDNRKLIEGLKKLNKSDPSVDVHVQSNGDIILNTCGEVHLQKCIVDLQTIYCKIPIKTSEPIINFRQTIIWTNPVQNKNQKYISELETKRKQIIKKQLMQKYKEEQRVDAELDENEKQKQRAVRQWDSHVQIYQSQDLTVEDIRFFFKNRDDQEDQKYNYKKDKQDSKFKKIDHRNKGKLHARQKLADLKLKTNLNTQVTPNGMISFKIKALGLEFEVAEYLQRNSDRMKNIFLHKKQNDKIKFQSQLKLQQQLKSDTMQFINQFEAKLQQFSVDPVLRKLIIEKQVCFSNHYGPNLLLIKQINKSQSLYGKQYAKHNNQQMFDFPQQTQNRLNNYKLPQNELLNSIILGFNLACDSGPMCCEQLMGTIFIIQQIKVLTLESKQEALQRQQSKTNNIQQQIQVQLPPEKILQQKQDKFVVQSYQKTIELEKNQEIQFGSLNNQNQKNEHKCQFNYQQAKETCKSQIKTLVSGKIDRSEQKNHQYSNDVFGPLTGQIMSTVKQTCQQAFLGASPRLVQPMYLVELQTQQQFYGSVYNQLSKRRAKVIEQNLHQITNLFIIKALLPIQQSSRFCFQILDRTSGTVNAQLNFQTWKIYPQDPFYVPFTEQQIQQGFDNTIPNSAKILLEKIRSKKGLIGIQKIVAKAQGQRTLKRK